MTARWYLRCSVTAVDADSEPAGLRCGACEGKIRVLGEVHHTRRRLVVGQVTLPPCDGRCTYAIGPSCDCLCEGRNHGAGLVACVTHTLTDAIPRVMPRRPEDARRRAEEWRAALRAPQGAQGSTHPPCPEQSERYRRVEGE